MELLNTDRDFEWYTEADLKKYTGKWVAIFEEKVIASDTNFKKVMEKVEKKFPKVKPLIAKVPENIAQII